MDLDELTLKCIVKGSAIAFWVRLALARTLVGKAAFAALLP